VLVSAMRFSLSLNGISNPEGWCSRLGARSSTRRYAPLGDPRSRSELWKALDREIGKPGENRGQTLSSGC
jgi:hypothetical protein